MSIWIVLAILAAMAALLMKQAREGGNDDREKAD